MSSHQESTSGDGSGRGLRRLTGFFLLAGLFNIVLTQVGGAALGIWVALGRDRHRRKFPRIARIVAVPVAFQNVLTIVLAGTMLLRSRWERDSSEPG